MTLRDKTSPSSKQGSRRSARAGSWMAILAMTTLGVTSAGTLTTRVRGPSRLRDDRSYRLIVQSYDSAEGDLVGELPAKHARPVGSAQRAVTGAELRNGIDVQLVELRDAPSGDGVTKPVVVAWVEENGPELEFDGRRARPGPGSFYGVAHRDEPGSAREVTIALDRRA